MGLDLECLSVLSGHYLPGRNIRNRCIEPENAINSEELPMHYKTEINFFFFFLKKDCEKLEKCSERGMEFNRDATVLK